MRVTPVPFAVFAMLVIAGCQEATAPASLQTTRPAMDASAPGVIAHISVGSNDLCAGQGLKPGCDGNFSLVANKYADGSVKGQWEDDFGKDADGNQLGGVHVAVDCLETDMYSVGIYSWPIAWVSGVVTKSTSSNPGVQVGDGVITLALDRGRSAKDSFEDLASFTVPLGLVGATSCQDRPALPVFLNVSYIGQVSIWFK